MKFILLLITVPLFSSFVSAQSVLIGKVIENESIITNDKQYKAIRVAYLRSFIDGRKLDSIYIDKIGELKYLILLGSKTNIKSKTVISISIINNTINLNANPEMKTCSNGACNDCEFFIENNKVVACKCNNDGTISNSCNFKVNDGNYFYTLVVKLIKE